MKMRRVVNVFRSEDTKSPPIAYIFSLTVVLQSAKPEDDAERSGQSPYQAHLAIVYKQPYQVFYPFNGGPPGPPVYYNDLPMFNRGDILIDASATPRIDPLTGAPERFIVRGVSPWDQHVELNLERVTGKG